MRLTCFVGLCLLVACSGKASPNDPAPDGGGGGGGDGGSAIEHACRRDADSYCDKLAACTDFALRAVYGDLAKCKARDLLWCDAALKTKDTGSTPELFVACAAAVDSQTCDDFNNGVSLEACQYKPGLRADGQACSGGAQCQSLSCKVPANASCGVCTTKSAVGGPCTANSDCASGSRCQQQLCVPEVGEGAVCGGTTAVCARPNVCLTGVCTKPLPVGAACDPFEDACDYGTFGAVCDRATNTCKAFVQLATTGQPCGVINGVNVNCAELGTCAYKTPSGASGTCTGPIPDGAPCDTANTGVLCTWPAACSNGVCRLPDPSGSGCPG